MQKPKSIIPYLLFLITILVLSGCINSSSTEPLKEIVQEIVLKQENLKFGMNVDDWEIANGKIKKNESLSEILLPFNISYDYIDKIAKNSRKIYNVNSLRAGKEYSIFYEEDSIKTGKYFVYQPNSIDFVVYELFKPFHIYVKKRDLEIRIKEAAGIINSSLYETMVQDNYDIELAMEISEVYAWVIDFFRIQKGDKYKVLFEEQYVDGESVGIGNILAAHFSHNNKDFYAFYFEKGDKVDYFDEKGNSLKKAFLKAPLKFSKITSRYSPKRFHPVLKKNIPHLGTDYGAPKGTPIMTVGDGVILEAKYKVGNGNYVKVRHNGTYTTGYLHMSKIASGIKPGVKVKQGQVIGFVGSTGLATGPHLCFRFYKNDKQIDALKVEIPPSEPVRKEFREEFNNLKSKLMNNLNEIDLST